MSLPGMRLRIDDPSRILPLFQHSHAEYHLILQLEYQLPSTHDQHEYPCNITFWPPV
jgi:hypothetical protein